jgi:hypothetical protein
MHYIAQKVGEPRRIEKQISPNPTRRVVDRTCRTWFFKLILRRSHCRGSINNNPYQVPFDGIIISSLEIDATHAGALGEHPREPRSAQHTIRRVRI